MSGAAQSGVLVHFLIKETDVDAEDLADIPEAAAADTVRAAFVFLDLLEGKSEHGSKFILAETKHFAAHTQTFADMDIDGVRVAVGGASAGRDGIRAGTARGVQGVIIGFWGRERGSGSSALSFVFLGCGNRPGFSIGSGLGDNFFLGHSVHPVKS